MSKYIRTLRRWFSTESASDVGEQPPKRCVSALKEWAGKSSATIIYDSTIDEFTDQGLFDKVQGKANIALVAFTADGDVFGGFYNVPVTEQNKAFKDPDMFVFSFESRGRCETPQRFAVKDERKGYKNVYFFKNNVNGRFVSVGGNYGRFSLGNERSDTCCVNLSRGFMGIKDDTLTGKPNCGRFKYTRIIAIYLL